MTKEERIKKEIARLQEIFKEIPKNEYQSIMKLIENLAFMAVTLDDLIEIVNKEPLVVETVNASQSFSKENPALTSYNKMYANYIKGLQQLISLLPDEKKPSNEPDDGAALISYLNKKRKRIKWKKEITSENITKK